MRIPNWTQIEQSIDEVLGPGYFKRQLAMGRKVEMEHTEGLSRNDALRLALRIALDHIREYPDYYDRLEVMEGEAKQYWTRKFGGW